MTLFAMKPLKFFSSHPKLLEVVTISLLVIITLFAHFLFAAWFGLYEDDYTYIGNVLTMNHQEVLGRLNWAITYWFQGRPMGYIIPTLIVWLVKSLNLGVLTLYGVAFVIQSLIVTLFYQFMKKFSGSKLAAFIGSCFFILYPAYTVQPLLMHGLSLQFSVLFLVIAALTYISGKKWVTFIMGALILMTYETPFLILFLLPLMRVDQWDRHMWRKLFKHGINLLALLVFYLLIRMALGGDDRLVTLSTQAYLIPFHFIANVFIGVAVNIFTFFSSIFQLIKSLSIQYIAAAGIGLLIFAVAFLIMPQEATQESEKSTKYQCRLSIFKWSKTFLLTVSDDNRFKRILFCLMAIVLSYPLLMNRIFPLKLNGRLTSIHMAAIFGGAALLGILFDGWLKKAQTGKQRLLPAGLLVLYLAGLTGFHHITQREFMTSFRYQQWFYTHVFENCASFEDGTVIIIRHDEFPYSYFIESFSWVTPHILSLSYQFPTEWEQKPLVMIVPRNWKDQLTRVDDHWVYQWDDTTQIKLHNDLTYLMQYQNNELAFINGKLETETVHIRLNTPSTDQTTCQYTPTLLFDYLNNPGIYDLNPYR